ncbi:shikimate dehydrogenase [Caldisphaera sp.]|uniref:shikimate dehydrogenase family protein n=1 Tax=Caldisphaera sp. TaxID=2060322 RepID=UPI0025BAACF8|nr:shikimate dehydrogenase [Caldisphaera sp.]
MSKLSLGLLGENISKSPSPILHNFIYNYFNIEAEYKLYEIKRESFHEKINYIIKNNYGLNVTMPYKELIIKYTKEVSDDAKKIGAINTIKGDIGYNTDYLAFKKMLSQYDIKTCLIMGAGGSARAASFAVSELDPDIILIYNRSVERAMNLINDLKKIGTNATYIQSLNGIEVDALINTIPVDLDFNIKSKTIYVDLVYTRKAKKISQNIIDGIDFLIEQGLLSDEIWFNIKADEEVKKYVRKLVRKSF